MKINQQNEKTMANRPVELRKQNRPTIVHQNQNLNVSAEPSQNLSRNSERRNLNRPEKDEPENANQPTEISDQNLNRTQSIESNNSNQSDVPPTTTLFEQIALQVHRYKGNFLYLQKLPGILNLLEIVSKTQNKIRSMIIKDAFHLSLLVLWFFNICYDIGRLQ